MASATFRLVGVELYFADLPRARHFYEEVLGLELAEIQAGHHAKFTTTGGFVCLECRGRRLSLCGQGRRLLRGRQLGAGPGTSWPEPRH